MLLQCVNGAARLILAVLIAFGAISFGASDAWAKRRKAAPYSPPKAALIADGYNHKILYSSKADEPRYPASLTKVMTLYLTFEFIKTGKISFDSELTVTAYAASQPACKLHLKPGETIRVRDAVRALITESANDAAVVIAENLSGTEEAFAKLMTQRARMLGMKNTTFKNAHGLTDAGQRTTAYDMMVLARSILRDFPEEASLFKTKYFKYKGKLHKNHNALLFSYVGAEGMKTGFTNASGFNLITTAKRDGRFLIGVVLGGSSSRQRNETMKSLLNASWKKARPKPAGPLMAAKPSAPKPQLAVARAGFLPSAMSSVVAPIQPATPAPGQVARLQPPATVAQPEKPINQAVHAPVEMPAGGGKGALLTASLAPMTVADDLPETGHAGVRLAAVAGQEADVMPSVQTSSRPQPAAHQQAVTAALTTASQQRYPGPFHLQVGAYDNAASAQARLAIISKEAGDVLSGYPSFVFPGKSAGRDVLRARFGAFSETAASNACEALKMRSIDCIVLRAQ